MNAQKRNTFKFLVQLRLDRIRTDYAEQFIEEDEFDRQVSELIATVIEKSGEHETIKEVMSVFTVKEVVHALGLQEQNENLA